MNYIPNYITMTTSYTVPVFLIFFFECFCGKIVNAKNFLHELIVNLPRFIITEVTCANFY